MHVLLCCVREYGEGTPTWSFSAPKPVFRYGSSLSLARKLQKNTLTYPGVVYPGPFSHKKWAEVTQENDTSQRRTLKHPRMPLVWIQTPWHGKRGQLGTEFLSCLFPLGTTFSTQTSGLKQILDGSGWHVSGHLDAALFLDTWLTFPLAVHQILPCCWRYPLLPKIKWSAPSSIIILILVNPFRVAVLWEAAANLNSFYSSRQ